MDIPYLNTEMKLKFEIDDTYFTQFYDTDVKEELVKEEITIEDEVLQRVIYPSLTDYADLLIESSRLCSLCHKVFPNSFTFLQHNISHLKVPITRIQVHDCDRCPQKLQSKTDLENHIRTKHLKLQPSQNQLQKCKICNKVYSRKYWHSHLKDVHGKANLKCIECNMQFKCSKYLKRHKMFVHDKVFKEWRFSANQTLGQTTKKQCEQCQKLLNKHAIKAHMKNCHGEEVECDICKKKFKSKPYLNTHIARVHLLPGQECQCEHCGKVMKSKHRVKIHIQNTHKNFLS